MTVVAKIWVMGACSLSGDGVGSTTDIMALCSVIVGLIPD